jgi:hypothetical protein
MGPFMGAPLPVAEAHASPLSLVSVVPVKSAGGGGAALGGGSGGGVGAGVGAGAGRAGVVRARRGAVRASGGGCGGGSARGGGSGFGVGLGATVISTSAGGRGARGRGVSSMIAQATAWAPALASTTRGRSREEARDMVIAPGSAGRAPRRARSGRC